ncbi:hypothetical protein HHK36_005865 [Tetracentron sinense]|uniref:Phosphoribulokinase/uridine kinase domain-containing protein n=1 Tax=Tetracentron sinense TaxID=13715 RepID=A0A835DN84_TETSI|nr:hypothetical protein HHK36_005865 [Tetracentron sinense]
MLPSIKAWVTNPSEMLYNSVALEKGCVQRTYHAAAGTLKIIGMSAGVAGGAASGKTTVCDMIIEQLHDQRVVLVNQDSFYHNLTEEELTRVHEYNFDHPDAFDTEKLLCSMDKLKHGQAVDIPNPTIVFHNLVFWNFCETLKEGLVNPSDVILLEGILVFHDPRVRELMNMKIFVDTVEDNMEVQNLNLSGVQMGISPAI